MTDRSNLQMAPLRKRVPLATRLMNIKIPVQLSEAINRVARELHVSKTQVVIALLKEGLERADKVRGRKRKRSD